MTAAAPASKRAEPAPLIVPRDDSAVFHGQYTVILKDNSDSQALTNVMKLFPGNATQVYGNLFKGFTAELDEASLGALRDHPAVWLLPIPLARWLSIPFTDGAQVDLWKWTKRCLFPTIRRASWTPSRQTPRRRPLLSDRRARTPRILIKFSDETLP